MTPAALGARLHAAQVFAREAGAEARRYFRDFASLETREKGAHDLVTAADLAVDRRLRASISHAFPQDAILTEESGAKGDSANLWVIDPIDGTGNFARGLAHFAISIAFVHDHETQLGVVYDVMADEMFVAQRGGGATCNGESIRASRCVDPNAALVEAGYSSRHPIEAYHKRLRAMISEGFEFCQHGSAALGLAHVACGRLDGYWELDLFSWDVLAGLLLVKEAGGWASAYEVKADGGASLTRGQPTLACGSALADALVRIVGLSQKT